MKVEFGQASGNKWQQSKGKWVVYMWVDLGINKHKRKGKHRKKK